MSLVSSNVLDRWEGEEEVSSHLSHPLFISRVWSLFTTHHMQDPRPQHTLSGQLTYIHTYIHTYIESMNEIALDDREQVVCGSRGSSKARILPRTHF